MKAVILTAGKGTRMRAVSLRLAKILLPLGQGTIGDNLLRGLKEAGVSNVLMIVGHMEKQVRKHFGDGSALGVHIEYFRQARQLGTGHAASLACDFVKDEPFFVLAYGDIATPAENCDRLVSDFQEHSPEASLSVYPVDDPSQGAAVFVEEGYLKNLVEKPRQGKSTSQFNNAGIYIFTPRIFDMLERIGLSPRKEYELTDALMLLVTSGHKVRACELHGFWSNVSSPEDLLEVNRLAIEELNRRREVGTEGVGSGVNMSPLAFVHPSATVAKCSIGPYTVVDRNARVMDGATISQAVICRDVIVGKSAILDHVLVRPGCEVKSGMRYAGSEDKVLILPDEA
jgi:NDP-sugar pyrophosphorylase family protein